MLYAKRGGNWWLQPLQNQPFTPIQSSGAWSNATHLGSQYAALLVEPVFRPEPVLAQLPAPGNKVAALIQSAGRTPRPTYLKWSGYEWRIRNAATSRGGANFDDARNVWTDKDGALHLCIAQRNKDWTSAELSLPESLGYGTYSFLLRDTAGLDPAAVFSMFTWDYSANAQDSFNNEMSIEISHWGDTRSKNAEYVVQPYYTGANVFRFAVPPGALLCSLRWEPGRAQFRTSSGSDTEGARLIAERTMTSQIPTPGMETIRFNLYVFRSRRTPITKPVEVVLEKFEYLP